MKYYTSEHIYELTRTCPNSENKSDWLEKKWISVDEVIQTVRDIELDLNVHIHMTDKDIIEFKRLLHKYFYFENKKRR